MPMDRKDDSELKKAGLKYEVVDWLAPVSRRDREAKVAKKNEPVDPKKVAAGKKLLDQAIAARGGGKFTSMKLVTAKGSMKINTPKGAIDGTMARAFAPPAQLRTDLGTPQGVVRLVFTSTLAFAEFKGQVQEIPGDALATVRAVLFADVDAVLLHKDATYFADGQETIDGKAYDVLVARAADGSVEARLLLDPKTHLPFRIVYEIEGEKLTDEYADWKPFSGVQIPTSIKTVNLLLQVPVDIAFTSVEVNGKLPDGGFDKP